MSMRTVLKWPITLQATPQMIGGGKILLVADQYGVMTVWTEEILQDDKGFKDVPKTREIVIVGTGHAASEDYQHIGSCLTQGGTFVWHLYEKVAW